MRRHVLYTLSDGWIEGSFASIRLELGGLVAWRGTSHVEAFITHKSGIILYHTSFRCSVNGFSAFSAYVIHQACRMLVPETLIYWTQSCRTVLGPVEPRGASDQCYTLHIMVFPIKHLSIHYAINVTPSNQHKTSLVRVLRTINGVNNPRNTHISHHLSELRLESALSFPSQ